VIEGTSGDVRVKALRWILAAIVLLEGLGVLGYAVFLGVETVVGHPTEPAAAAAPRGAGVGRDPSGKFTRAS